MRRANDACTKHADNDFDKTNFKRVRHESASSIGTTDHHLAWLTHLSARIRTCADRTRWWRRP
eukprot:2095797-Pleurochrysis_carterae.AAC.2